MIQQSQSQPEPTFLEYPYRFAYKDQALWRRHLEEQGFVVIANWLPESDCQQYVSEFWQIMEKLSDGLLDRNDKSTQVLGKNYPSVLHGGMIQYIGHSRPQWQLRKRCAPLFRRLWGCEQVKSSFDGFCFMNGMRNYKKVQRNSFLHSDQSPMKNYLWSYQGIMCLTEAADDGGGFVVVPKSHRYHYQYFKDKNLLNQKENWFIFPQEDKVKQPICHDIKVNNKAGDFILFDSRSFHCNTKPTTPTLRVCTYICMLPSTKIPQKQQKLRVKALKQRRTSNHHAGDGFKTFPILPRYLSDPEKFRELVEEVNGYEVEGDQGAMEMI